MNKKDFIGILAEHVRTDGMAGYYYDKVAEEALEDYEIIKTSILGAIKKERDAYAEMAQLYRWVDIDKQLPPQSGAYLVLTKGSSLPEIMMFEEGRAGQVYKKIEYDKVLFWTNLPPAPLS